ncbi:hypothetical protein AX17_002724 [Amanita inopinata Kibby_2008]|nr:hypothetical protein AX17_002724 [Amanita inopinata Kibby_2008]
MQNNRPRLQTSTYNPRAREKQRFSIKGLGTKDRVLPVYMNVQENGNFNYQRGPFSPWTFFRSFWKRMPRPLERDSKTLTSSHSKELPPLSPSSQTSNVTFLLLCSLWYSSSALSSNTGKAILNHFRYPITLTFVQFGFVALYCLLLMSPLVRFSRLRPPTKAVMKSTLPMGIFQVGGHMFSSIAISRIPVSTVHTIKVAHFSDRSIEAVAQSSHKALSPLFTVAAYALLFDVSYSGKTYVSLLPLTFGVMLACSFDVSASNATGLLCAFGSAVVFVSSNIFFKKIMPSSANGSALGTSHKLDKLNLLFYSSSAAFILMLPIWMYYDFPILISASSHPEYGQPRNEYAISRSVLHYFFMNGTVHFAQNIIAFIILSSTSPVTYSIASLIKRVAVICIAIIWFKQSVHPIQAIGILMTFAGLYMYNQSKADVERGEQEMKRVEAARGLILPTTQAESRMMGATINVVPSVTAKTGLASASAHGRGRGSSVATSSSSYYQSYPNNVHQQVFPTSAGLKIDTTSSMYKARNKDSIHVNSPIDSYPSPPPSIDSPPSRTLVLDEEHHQAGPVAVVG